MTASAAASRFMPWSGWVGATLALALNHQGIADLVYFRCTAGNPVSTVALGAVSLMVAWAGALIGWRSRDSRAEDPDRRTRKFISLVGLMLAGLYSVAILFQMLAGLIIPVCFR